jgi:SAM-dependent methyltransferase
MKTCEFVVGRLSLVKNETRKEIENAQCARYAHRPLEYRKIRLIDHLMPSGPGSFLDLGSGSGVYLPLLARKGTRVVGLDASHDLCRLSKSQGFDIVVGDAMHLPFRDYVFDGVWASEVLEHLPSLDVLDDLEKIAKQCIVATIPNPYSRNYKADSSHKLRYTISSLKVFLKARTGWSYTVLGLGIEWPSAPGGVRLPKSVKLLSYYLTYYLPWLAPTICIAGYKKQERN